MNFRPADLMQRAKGKAQALKAFLLDQRVVAGLGNIYVCEALFRAGLAPDAEAGELAAGKRGAAAAERLAASIKAVLTDALAAGGSSIRDYRDADGTEAAFKKSLTSMAAPGSLAITRAVRRWSARSSRGARPSTARAARRRPALK